MTIHATECILQYIVFVILVQVMLIVVPVISFAQEGPLYYIEEGSSTIFNTDLDGTNETIVIENAKAFPAAVALDPNRGFIFWTNSSNATNLEGSIGRANLDGSDWQELISDLGALGDIVVDTLDGAIYWVNIDEDAVLKTDVGGGGTETILPFDVQSLEIDAAGRKLYWVSNEREILRSNLDGSDVEVLVSGADIGNFLLLDVPGGSMYWTSEDQRNILRATLDGSDVETLFHTYRVDGFTIDPQSQHLYWTLLHDTLVNRSNLDGSDSEKVIDRGCERVAAVDADHIYCMSRIIDRFQKDGSGRTPLIDEITRLVSPSNLLVHVSDRKLYWADRGLAKIRRAEMDGTNIESIEIDGYPTPPAFHLDEQNNLFYWTDKEMGRIMRASLDGRNPEILFEDTPGTLSNPTVDPLLGWLYWVDLDDVIVRRLNMNSGVIEDLFDPDPQRENSLRHQVAFDAVNQRIMWSGFVRDLPASAFWSANLDGTDKFSIAGSYKGQVPVIRLDPSGGQVFSMVTDDNFWGHLFREETARKNRKGVFSLHKRIHEFALDWGRIPMETISGITLVLDSFRYWSQIKEGETFGRGHPDFLYKLNMEANVFRQAESVAFTLDGKLHRIENEPPYALFGDVDGVFADGSFTSGEHTITAVAYSEDNAKGRAGEPYTLSFTFKNGLEINRFELSNALNGAPLGVIEEGMQFDLATKPEGITVFANAGSRVRSVYFELQPTGYTHTETVEPFTLWGDNPQSGLLPEGRLPDGRPIRFEPGSYTLIATPYEGADLQGRQGPKLEINFEVINSNLTSNNKGGSGELKSLAHKQNWETGLAANYPNPFNPVTTIRYSLKEQAAVRLVIYDVLGRAVHTLVDGTHSAGQHELHFDASHLPSGTYLYRLETPEGVFVQKMLLLK